MKKIQIKIFLLLLLTLNVSCDSDPSGKFFWVIFGFPLLGISYFLGNIILNFLFSNKKDNKNNVVASIIVGIIAISIIYSIFK